MWTAEGEDAQNTPGTWWNPNTGRVLGEPVRVQQLHLRADPGDPAGVSATHLRRAPVPKLQPDAVLHVHR